MSDFLGIVNHTNSMGSPVLVIEPPEFVEAVRKIATPDTKWVLATTKDDGSLESLLGAFNNPISTLEAIKAANTDWLYLIQSGPYMLQGESVYDERFWVGVHNRKSLLTDIFSLRADRDEELQKFADHCKQHFGKYPTLTLSVVENELAWAIRAAFPDEANVKEHHYLFSEWDVLDTEALFIVEEWADDVQERLVKHGFNVDRLDNPDHNKLKGKT